jgi:protein-tyrosine phosphatase
MAEGLLSKKVTNHKLSVEVDSAGTSGYHIGEKPDSRMIETAKSFGVTIDNLKARKFSVADFDNFDIIYAMDASNYSNIILLARTDTDKNKVHLLLNELEPGKNLDVPDPYFGGEKGFIAVYNMLDAATDKIIEKIK